MNPSGSSPWMHTSGGNRTSSRRRPPASARSTSLRPNGLILNSSGPKPSQSVDALYICEPFRERSKIGGSLLSSEGPAFEVYIDAAPRVRCYGFLALTCLSQEGRLEK